MSAVALARAVADAVLWEGYLLYPYRSTSRKNQVRWQFGVLGPPGAASSGSGEEPDLAVECLLGPGAGEAAVDVVVRFLQVQTRTVEREVAPGAYEPVGELVVDGRSHLTWDEAVERELAVGPYGLRGLRAGVTVPLAVEGGEDVEELRDAAEALVGRVVRRREALSAELVASVADPGPVLRLTLRLRNTGPDPLGDKDAAARTSLVGTHLILHATRARFVSVIDPPPDAAEAAAACVQRRCWPVLAGPEGADDLVLASPIILYDHPAVAPQSAGPLFDSTEIDEILTLRVLTLTDEEKAAARATDPQAAAVIDRCEAMSPQDLQRLHGVLREGPWWDPGVDAAVHPESDAVEVAGVRVAKGSRVRLNPSRRADAQDMFSAGREARVAAVHRDVDGQTHVAVVLLDDPAADLHDWYGRYLYFAPDEVEPLGPAEDRARPLREEGPR